MARRRDVRWVATFRDRLGFETVHMGEDETDAAEAFEHFADDNDAASPRGLPYHARPRLWMEEDGLRIPVDLVWCVPCGRITRQVGYECRECGE